MTHPRILITAGPTHEPIDRVRSLANHATGRLGIHLAGSAVALGAPTTLLLGPTPLEPARDPLLETQRFRTTADLEALLEAAWPEHDILLMTAAVADYRPRTTAPDGKLPRRTDGLTLELDPTPDLLAGLAADSRPDQLRVGWALEAVETLRERAEAKLERKSLHLIVANPLETIGSEHIEPLVLAPGPAGAEVVACPAPHPSKADFARWLLEETVRRQAALRPA